MNNKFLWVGPMQLKFPLKLKGQSINFGFCPILELVDTFISTINYIYHDSQRNASLLFYSSKKGKNKIKLKLGTICKSHPK